MKKTVYTLEVGGYSPAIVGITRPFLKRYAEKIGAELVVITERKFPDLPIACEKFQVGQMATDRGDDVAYFFDADALIHPNFPDIALFIPPDTVCNNANDFAPIRWQYTPEMQSDGRHIGCCNWLAFAPRSCFSYWTPPEDMRYLPLIHPTTDELAANVDARHLYDDFTCSQNVAQFGLKYTTVTKLLKDNGFENDFFYHVYLNTEAEKIALLREAANKMRPYVLPNVSTK